MIKLKRAYDPPGAEDGVRILVDRLWQRYERELLQPEKRAILTDLAERSRRGVVTLVFAAKDEVRNNAVVLKGLIERIARKAA